VFSSGLFIKDMESNINHPDFWRAEVPLDEPHFDEEATLMAARPVVPLHEVKSEERSIRRLIFASVLVGAIMVGVLGATLVYRQRADNRSTAVVETGRPVSEPDPAESRLNQVGGASTNSDVGQAAQGSHESAPSMAEQADDHVGRQESENDDASIVPNRPSLAISGKPAESVGKNQTNEDEDDDLEEISRAELKEARRLKRLEREARRDAKRETRADKGRSDNDLLRIREIFEGSPRP
jgi:hypothetical protein